MGTGSRGTPRRSLTIMSAPSTSRVVSLYRLCLRLGSNFTDYNMRHYAVRCLKQDFRILTSASAQEDKAAAYSKGLQAAEMLHRQSSVYSLYAPRDRVHVAEQL